MADEFLAHRRQCPPAAGGRHQRRTHRRLQPLHLRRHRRGGAADRLGRPGEGAAVGEGEERAQHLGTMGQRTDGARCITPGRARRLEIGTDVVRGVVDGAEAFGHGVILARATQRVHNNGTSRRTERSSRAAVARYTSSS